MLKVCGLKFTAECGAGGRSTSNLKSACLHNYGQPMACCIGLKLHGHIAIQCSKHTLQQREISWNQEGGDWLQICLSNLRVFFIHMSPSRKHGWLSFHVISHICEGILHRCWKQRKMQMLTITSAAIFSLTYANVVIPQHSHKRGRIHQSRSALCASSTHVIIQLYLVLTASCPQIGENFAKVQRMTLKFHLANLDLSAF